MLIEYAMPIQTETSFSFCVCSVCESAMIALSTQLSYGDNTIKTIWQSPSLVFNGHSNELS